MKFIILDIARNLLDKLFEQHFCYNKNYELHFFLNPWQIFERIIILHDGEWIYGWVEQ